MIASHDLAFDALLLLAAISDIRRYRIPNWLCAVVALAGLALAFPATPAEALSRLASFALVSTVAGGLWLRGILGGGDMKLLMACAVWIPLGGFATFAVALGAASGVQGAASLAWAALRRRTPCSAALRDHLPYAVSIATAGLVWSFAQAVGPP